MLNFKQESCDTNFVAFDFNPTWNYKRVYRFRRWRFIHFTNDNMCDMTGY